ncbi:MAG: YlzJ-like family protein [Alicyclobacillus sp.]|nr:YlzJ-like family protein [Alicyclobacillus sp.]
MSLFWSVFPTEIVFQDSGEAAGTPRLARVNGVTMSLLDTGDGRARIERILSTDPAHFLRPDWQPGQLLNLSGCTFLDPLAPARASHSTAP